VEVPISKLSSLAVLLASILPVTGQVMTVEARYVDGFKYLSPLRDSSGVPLIAGLEINGDGAIIQIGYFPDVSLDPAEFEASHWKTFTPLTGFGSPNAGRYPTSIGDADAPATGPFGFFFLPAPVAIELDPLIDLGLPSEYPARLGIRFFDGTTLENSTGYNTVTSDDPLWQLVAPGSTSSANAVLNMDLHQLFWESGDSGTFQTSIAYVPTAHVPEPGVEGTFFLVGVLMVFRRKRAEIA
jgi:hypothetical protein